MTLAKFWKDPWFLLIQTFVRRISTQLRRVTTTEPTFLLVNTLVLPQHLIFLTNIDMSKFRLKEINVQFYYFLKNSILTTNLISQNKKFQLNSTKFCCWVFLAKIDIFLKLILNVSILLYKNQLLRQNKHLGLPNLAWKWTSTKVGLQNHQFVSRWSYFTHRRNDKFAFWCHNFGQSPQSLSVSMEQKVEAILREFSDNKENQFLFSKLENHQLIWRIKLTSCQLWLFNGKMETSSCQM